MALNEQTPSSVLIIDDTMENRLLLASQLSSEKYRILSATTGLEGIDLAQKNLPDLVLLDVMLPEMNGFEVCRRLKKHPKTTNIPIIMITSLRDVTYRIRGIEAGADEFLSRPHHREELLIRVKSLVQLKRARERLEAERNHLQLLYDVSQVTTHSLNLAEMISNIIDYTQKAVGATKGSVLLTDHSGLVTHKFLARAISGVSVGASIADKVMQEGFAGWLWSERNGGIVLDTSDDPRWVPLPNDEEPAGSAVGAPLAHPDNGVYGLIILTHPSPHYFQDSHLALLKTIGVQVTAAVRNARLFNTISEEQRKLSAILNQSNDAIVTTDEQQRIVLFNDRAEGIFGIETDSIVGRYVEDIPELQSLTDLFDQADESVAMGRDILLHENCILYGSVTPVKGAGYIAVLQDVTERIKMERREKEELRDLFGRYVSPSLLEHVSPNNRNLLERRKRWAIILFADLRNNTEIIVNLPAEKALDLLNEIFAMMTEVVYRYEGTILDLIGDELEVGFNIPDDQPDAAQRALLTAIEMQRKFDLLRPQLYERSGAQIGLGVGIDQGEAIIGNVGSDQRMNLALVGKAVNMAHRMVDMAADGQIVVSADFYRVVEQESKRQNIQFNSIGDVKIKGFREPREVFRAQLYRQPLDAQGRPITVAAD
ncbi:MAG: response regulator [Candidatus Promineifilaceae bacterium]